MLETFRRWVKAQRSFLSLSLSHKGKAETAPTTWAAVASEVEGRASEQEVEAPTGLSAPPGLQGLLTITQGPEGDAQPLRSGGDLRRKPTSGMDTAYLSDESSALPEKNVVTSRQPRLPTPWTWKTVEGSSAELCWEHTVSKDQGED